MNNAEKMTGLTLKQVLASITSGKIHPDSRTVAIHGIAPQAISGALPQPRFMVGCLAPIPPDIWKEAFPNDPLPL